MQIETYIFWGLRMKNICKNICLFLSLIVTTALANTVSIEPYNHERDFQAIQHILDATPHYVRYESMGYPAGTTEQYLVNPQFVTEVLRVDNKTVGFVNYYMHHVHVLTFYLLSIGLVHLIALDPAYQGKGYGAQLLAHVIEKMEQNNMPTAMLNVKVNNTKARKLYEKAGFVPLAHAGDDIFYTKQLNIPTDKLPQGNSIQRHKKISTAIAVLTLASLVWWKYIR